MNDVDDRELRELIEGHLCDSLGFQQERRLRQLVTDPRCTAFLREQIHIDLQLRAAHDADAGQRIWKRLQPHLDDRDGPSPTPSPRRAHSPFAGRTSTRRATASRRSARRRTLVAMMLMLLGGGAIALLMLREPGIQELPPVRWSVAIGTLIAHEPVTDLSEKLQRGDRVPVDLELKALTSPAALKSTSGSRVELDVNTRARSSAAIPGSHLLMLEGGAQAMVATRAPGAPWELHSPHARIQVLGTSFRCEATADRTIIRVQEGRVRVAAKHHPSSAILTADAAIALSQRPPMELLAGRITAELRGSVGMEVEQMVDGSLPEAHRGVSVPYLEEQKSASDETCVCLPGQGQELTTELPLSEGNWHLWVRWRDDNEPDPIAFSIWQGDKRLGTVVGTGKSKHWHWTSFSLASDGTGVPVRLRSERAASGEWKSNPDRHPHLTVTRFDRIVLTQDANWQPE